MPTKTKVCAAAPSCETTFADRCSAEQIGRPAESVGATVTTETSVGAAVSGVKTGECAVGVGIGEAVGVSEPPQATSNSAVKAAVNSRTTD